MATGLFMPELFHDVAHALERMLGGGGGH
jgi:hypothetical protein